MRLSELFANTSLGLDNVTSRKWSEAMIVANLNVQLRSLVRQLTLLDQGYHNHVFQLSKDAAVQKHAGRWSYRMPAWVMKVSLVREGRPSDEGEGRVIAVRQKFHNAGDTWMPGGNLELLYFGSQAIDLEIQCAKLPARMRRGTLPDQTGMAANEIRLDANVASPQVFQPEHIADSYGGGIFELTGVDTLTRTVAGQMRRGLTSAHGVLLAGPNTHHAEVTVDADWTLAPVEDDTYEMHAEIQDEHLRLLELMSIRSLLAQERNVDGIRAYEGEVREQMALFNQHVSQRDVQTPKIALESIPTGYELEPPVWGLNHGEFFR